MKRTIVEQVVDKIHILEQNIIDKGPAWQVSLGNANTDGMITLGNEHTYSVLASKLAPYQQLENDIKKYVGGLDASEDVAGNWESILESGKGRASFTLVDLANQVGKLFTETDPKLVTDFWTSLYAVADTVIRSDRVASHAWTYETLKGLRSMPEPQSVKNAYKKLPDWIPPVEITIDTPKDVAKYSYDAEHPITGIMEYQGPAAVIKVTEGAAYGSGNKVAIGIVDGIKVVGTKIGEVVYDIADTEGLGFFRKIWLYITHPLGILGVRIAHKDMAAYLDEIDKQDTFYDPLGIGELGTDILFGTPFGIAILVVGGVVGVYFFKNYVKPVLGIE